MGKKGKDKDDDDNDDKKGKDKDDDDKLTWAQKKGAVSYLYRDASEFDFSYGTSYEHRIFIFKGSKALACKDPNDGGTWNDKDDDDNDDKKKDKDFFSSFASVFCFLRLK